MKKDPNLVNFQKMRKIYNGGVLALIIATIVIFLTALYQHSMAFLLSPFTLFSWAACLLAFVLSTVSVMRQQRYWNAYEQRRNMAVQDMQRYCASQQPAANGIVLPFPFIMENRTNWPRFLFISGAFIVAIAIVGCLFAFILSLVVVSSVSLWLLLGYVVGLLEFCIVLLLLQSAVSRSRQRIEITEQDMTVHSRGKSSSIAWSEARLFAIVGMYGIRKTRAGRRYQLASDTDVAQWTFVRKVLNNRTNRLAITQPKAYEEYEKQMNNLLSFIIARTGLPLIDLR